VATKYWVALLFIACAAGCATPETRKLKAVKETEVLIPYTKIVPADLQKTYEAVQRVFSIYKIKDSRISTELRTATLETQHTVGEDHNPALYQSPEPPLFHNNIRFSVSVAMREGSSKGKKATKLDVMKSVQVRDNIEGWKPISSDTFEELVLLDQKTKPEI
jgi:hypothetical protein